MLSRMLTRREQAVITSIAIATIVGSGVVYWRMSRAVEPNPDVLDPPIPAPPRVREPLVPASLPRDESPSAALPVEAAEDVAVAIQGAVRRPGMYRLEGDARVQDLIDEAGGLSESAELASINLAAVLIDGTTLTIPETVARGFERRRETVWNPPQYTVLGQLTPATPQAALPVNRFSGQSVSSAQTVRGLLDLNRATAEDLESLPGIGPVLAAAIVDYRGSAPFASVEDLLNVSGIGPKRLDAIRPLVTVE